ncbi:MAG: RNA pseudouridine synthase [Spirochaetales bacterium]|nr:RNA pseudouridine synthase [Spirochaetales bacterium]
MGVVVFRNADFIIADKPHGIPTVPLKGQAADGTLLGLAAAECPEILCVNGRNPWEYGAVHRLDTATSGLVLFALTQDAYGYLMEIQKKDLLEKTYEARVIRDDRLRGFDPPALRIGATFTIMSYFRSYGPKSKEVRPVEDIKRADTPVLYTTYVTCAGQDIVHCTITRGFRHQIRAHLAWAGLPIEGDPVYGPSASPEVPLALDCRKVSFPASDGERFSFSKT